MKNHKLPLLALMLLLCSCKKYVQIVYTKPIGTEIKNDHGIYSYENNDVRVDYDFWSYQGSMAFNIYNKTNKPIYIDWNKSSFVQSNRKYPYFNNSEKSNVVVVSKGRSAHSLTPVYDAIVGANNTVSTGSGTSVKEEKITFIPPHSAITKRTYRLIDYFYFRTDIKTEPGRINEVNVLVTYPVDKVQFRNFLSYSSREDFASESYVDNGFEIPKIVSVPENEFEGFKKANRFFLSNIKWSDIKKKFPKSEYKELEIDEYDY